jgi:hypothetical protein
MLKKMNSYLKFLLRDRVMNVLPHVYLSWREFDPRYPPYLYIIVSYKYVLSSPIVMI